VIGDVHGCIDELERLLKELSAGASDRIISVGDLIGKGPSSRAVLDWAMAARAECVVGNHELRFLECWKKGVVPREKPYDLETYQELGEGYERYMRFIDSWPAFIDGGDFLVVHGGFDPRRPIAGQDVKTLAGIRRLKDLDVPWYEEYRGEKLVVFGHWAQRGKPIVRANAIGLDTGCVYGEALTALVLPERRLVSVRAKKVYREKDEWR